MHPSHTLLVTVYTAPAQSLSAAQPPRKAPECEGLEKLSLGEGNDTDVLRCNIESGVVAFPTPRAGPSRYCQGWTKHHVLPPFVLTGGTRAVRSHFTKPCRNATGVFGLRTPQESIPIFGREIFCRALLASWLSAPSAAALADRLCSEPQLLPAASHSLLAR